MCGIAGYFFFSKKRNTCGTIRKMSAEIAHRGPDDEGFVFIDTQAQERTFLELASNDSDKVIKEKRGLIEDNSFNFSHNLAMAHRRFSIIDLSPSGHQPMWDEDRTLCVVFNGEILNYIELREELKSHGKIFRTNSDTEVILRAYAFWGKAAFQRFSGFWAIALYDRRKNILVLSRDRIGKKPLYIYHDTNVVVWASEIKSILQLIPSKNLHLDEQSFWNYLYYGKRDIAHSTFWAEIKMMDNATCTVISPGGSLESETYWELPTTRWKEEDIPIQLAQERFTELLKISLNERLRADVPIAFELSGGMDSSSLVALRANLKKENFSTFTVKYDNPEVDESPFALQLAEYFPNVDHHIINFEEENLWEHMHQFIYLLEEPFHSPNLLVNQLLRRKMRTQGYKVLVSGAGGDEVLAGYTEYAVPVLKKLIHEGKYLGVIKNILFYKERYPLRFRPLARILLNKIFKKASGTFFYDRYSIMEMNMDNEKTRGLVVPKAVDELLVANMKDLKMYYWMSSGDKSTMGIPIEARAPFLDHRVVEFLFSLPVSYLMRNGWLKWLLRKSLRHVLPYQVLWRKQKMGFPFPLEKWLSENEHIIKGVLSEYDNQWIHNKMITHDFVLLLENHPDFLWRAFNFQLWYSSVVCNEKVDYQKYQG
jgi:asparagine synthase (glutamine-hydrolysing)